jgi:hypothetical protein
VLIFGPLMLTDMVEGIGWDWSWVGSGKRVGSVGSGRWGGLVWRRAKAAH